MNYINIRTLFFIGVMGGVVGLPACGASEGGSADGNVKVQGDPKGSPAEAAVMQDGYVPAHIVGSPPIPTLAAPAPLTQARVLVPFTSLVANEGRPVRPIPGVPERSAQ